MARAVLFWLNTVRDSRRSLIVESGFARDSLNVLLDPPIRLPTRQQIAQGRRKEPWLKNSPPPSNANPALF